MIRIINIRYKIGNGKEKKAGKNVQKTIAKRLKEFMETEYKETNTTADFDVIAGSTEYAI